MMQKKVQIISDGSLDLSQELTKEKDIEVVPFYVSFDSETYQKEMVEVGVREFYQYCAAGIICIRGMQTARYGLRVSADCRCVTADP